MNRIRKTIEAVRAKNSYKQPVYIPGYEYHPWKKWVALSALAVVGLLIIAGNIGHKTEVDNQKSLNSHQATVQISSTQDGNQKTSNYVAYYPVDRVIDGDTIIVSINGKAERVRFIGVDTPETVDPRKPVQCFGVEASNYAKSLLTGKNVRLVSDGSQGDKDKYGRLLRYVFLADGTNVDGDLISKGFGHEYTYNTSYKYQAQYKQAENAAQTQKLGFWASSTCNGDTTQPATNNKNAMSADI